MSDVRTESREMMDQMFEGKKPKLGAALQPLKKISEFERVGAFTAVLSESERVYFKVLAENLPELLRHLSSSLEEESAARFLYDSFGLPKPEIAELATPVYLDLLEKLTLAHGDVREKVYRTQDTLLEFIRQIERNFLAIFVVRLNKLEQQRENCLESLKNLSAAKSEGATAEQRTGELATILADKLTSIEVQIKAFLSSQNRAFDFISSLEQKIQATDLINTRTDIAAPNPEFAL